jgi:hypothetical protein
MSVDHSLMKLGKLPARIDDRVPRMMSVLADIVPAAPAAHSWSQGRSDWGMLGNDNLGDCTAAGCYHLEEIATMETARHFNPSTANVIAFYSASTGYNPADPSTDRGGVEVDVLNFWQTHGILGRHLIGHATVEPQNVDHVKQGAFLFPGLYLGVALPLNAQTQDIWDYVAGPGSEPGGWGGHCIVLVDYDETYITVITWGVLKKATWTWFLKYCDEVHAVLPAAWIANAKSPGGIDVSALQGYMTAISGG